MLKAARTVFDTSGVDAPAKEITDLAGVGVGTLYRHFPQRSDLVKAVDYFLERLGPTLSALLDAAAAEGAIRGDISAEDLLYAVAQLCQPVPGQAPEHNRRIVGVLVDGLRRPSEHVTPASLPLT